MKMILLHILNLNISKFETKFLNNILYSPSPFLTLAITQIARHSFGEFQIDCLYLINLVNPNTSNTSRILLHIITIQQNIQTSWQ